ncbi:MAG: DUF1343 domain-containing protein [Phycisphaerae bacterium]|nr:DUF1343 domain-containing protein [Phycisphaerae bacterium]
MTRWMLIIVLSVLPSTVLAQSSAKPRVKLGLEVWVERGFAPLAGKRIGLISNPTGVTSDLRSNIDVLHEAAESKLVKLFGPEHGLRGDIFAGENVIDTTDPKTGLPVLSLYGKTAKPTPEMLDGLDALVYDMQDIGARSYTYISTMGRAMEAAAENNIEFVVLDRPNPIGGNKIEGNILDLKFQSGVGRYPIPYLYGMTPGELAQMINGEGWLAEGRKVKLHVIPMEGWRRDMWFEDTGLPWVMTSPHVPTAATAAMYAATGILGELHVVNEGVGYTMPFHMFGAPWLDAQSLAADLSARGLPGVLFRPLAYQVYYYKFKDEKCQGVQIYVTDPKAVELTAIQFHMMDIVRQKHPDHPLFGTNRDNMFDKVCGTDRIRKAFLDGTPIADILAMWREGIEPFRQARAKYLLYR